MTEELKTRVTEMLKANDVEIIRLAFVIIEENCDTFADFQHLRVVAERCRWPQDDQWKRRGMNKQEYLKWSFMTDNSLRVWKNVDKRVKEHGGRH